MLEKVLSVFQFQHQYLKRGYGTHVALTPCSIGLLDDDVIYSYFTHYTLWLVETMYSCFRKQKADKRQILQLSTRQHGVLPWGEHKLGSQL